MENLMHVEGLDDCHYAINCESASIYGRIHFPRAVDAITIDTSVSAQ